MIFVDTYTAETRVNIDEITKSFYKNHDDNYDFLAIYTTFKTDDSQFHIGIKSNVQGIGLAPFDTTSNFGSNKKLLGVVFLKDIDMYNTQDVLWANALIHEMAHQWGVHAKFIDETGTENYYAIHNRYNTSHWSKKLNMEDKVLGGMSYTDNGNGTFTIKESPNVLYQVEKFSEFELYLAGFIGKNDVSPIWRIESETDEFALGPGDTISGVKKHVTINNIIAAEGERTPTPVASQKDFSMAFILLTEPGIQPTQVQLDKMNYIATNYPEKWYESTHYKSTINGAQITPTPTPTPEPTPIPSPTPTSTPANLIRVSGDSKVYAIINNKRHWVPTAEIFNSYGYNWSKISAVSTTQLNNYSRAKLLKAENDPKVYYLTEGGQKRHIPSPQVFESYGNKWEDIITVSAAELNYYPKSSLIRAMGDSKVYKLENGKKRWIKTAETFNRLKYNWNNIAPVNSTELNHYPTGSDIE